MGPAISRGVTGTCDWRFTSTATISRHTMDPKVLILPVSRAWPARKSKAARTRKGPHRMRAAVLESQTQPKRSAQASGHDPAFGNLPESPLRSGELMATTVRRYNPTSMMLPPGNLSQSSRINPEDDRDPAAQTRPDALASGQRNSLQPEPRQSVRARPRSSTKGSTRAEVGEGIRRFRESPEHDRHGRAIHPPRRVISTQPESRPRKSARTGPGRHLQT